MLHVVRTGVGPPILLIHGSAVDHTTWSIQLASPLRDRFSLLAYDRRVDAPTIEAHADDAAGLLADASAPALVIGSSFGAIIALEVIRRYPERCAGAVLIEPPLATADAPATMAIDALAGFDRHAAERGGPAAAELFLRTVLGNAAYERMPRMYQERSKSKWAEIRADSVAWAAYRPRYAELATVTTPVLLLGGERSAPSFRLALDALFTALPDARLEVVAGAGHMLQAEAPQRFGELVARFGADLGLAGS